MVFEDKYFSGCILLPDQNSMSGCLSFVRYWKTKVITLERRLGKQEMFAGKIHLFSILNTKQTNDGIFTNKAEENFNLAKIFLNMRVRL